MAASAALAWSPLSPADLPARALLDPAAEASYSTRLAGPAASAAREVAGGSVRPTSLSDLHLHITALASLRASVLELHARAAELRERIEGLVAARQAAREQAAQVRRDGRVLGR